MVTYSTFRNNHICFNFYCAALNAGRSSCEKGVRLSVNLKIRLSVRQKRGSRQNGKKICPDFYTVRKII